MGTLKVGRLDIKYVELTKRIKSCIGQLIRNSDSYYSLGFKSPNYFKTLDRQPQEEKGWYIILHNGKAIYVGIADNLNSRLNSDNGSRDNFGNPTRTSDIKRNFIKRFNELKILSDLRVCTIKEIDLCSALGINPDELTDLDRKNIEKLIDIFRAYFDYSK